MVWGSFAGSRVDDLQTVRGTMNQNGDHSILQHHEIPSCIHLVGQGFFFQQDSDPKHTSRLCQNYLRWKNKTVGFKSWNDQQSVQTDPIKMIWDELDRRVKAKQPTSATHMWELLECWEEPSKKYLISFVKRMPQVCLAVMLLWWVNLLFSESAHEQKTTTLQYFPLQEFTGVL